MFPIKTIKNETKGTIVKICIEDLSRFSRRIDSYLERFLESTKLYNHGAVEYVCVENKIVPTIKSVGKATVNGDEFNEEIGNEIAFRKAKLNANIKKVNILNSIIKNLYKLLDSLEEEREKFIGYISNDIQAMRGYNPDYKIDISV